MSQTRTPSVAELIGSEDLRAPLEQARRRLSPEMRLSTEQRAVHLLFDTPRGVQAALVLCAALTVTVLWVQLDPVSRIAWPSVLALVGISSALLVRRYRVNRLSRPSTSWERLYLAHVFATGAMWGWLAAGLAPIESTRHMLFVVAVIAGIAAATATALGASRYGFAVFAVPAMLPVAIRLLLQTQNQLLLVTGLLIIVYIASLHLVSRQFHRTLLMNFRFRSQNEELMEELSQVNDGLFGEIEARERADREIAKRDAILEAVSFSAERLLRSPDFLGDPTPMLARLGTAAQVDRISLVTLRADDPGTAESIDLYQWRPQHSVLAPVEEAPALSTYPFLHRLADGEVISGALLDLGNEDRRWLAGRGACSMAMLPFFDDQSWRGVLVLEDPRERSWTKSEIEALCAAADMLGAAAARSRTEAELARSDSRYQMLAQNTNDLVTLHDLTGRCIYASPSCRDLLGREPEELLGEAPERLFGDIEAERLRRDGFDVAQAGSTATLSFPFRRHDGRTKWLEMSVQPVTDQQGEVNMLVASSRDVTGRKLAEDELFREKELAQVTLRSIGDGVITADRAGRTRFLNPAAETLIGWTTTDAAGRPLGELFQSATEEHQRSVMRLVEQSVTQDSAVRSLDVIEIQPEGRDARAVEVSAAPIHDRAGSLLGTVTVLRDVTRTQKLAAQLTYQATHDSLTGLFNRREFENRLVAVFTDVQQQNSDEPQRAHALCYVDLDQFKVVNDTCGHIAGDELLRQVAALLRGRIRKSDTVARLGGDEFGILLHDCPIDKAVEMADDLCRTVHEHRFTWDQQVFRLGASIGLVEISAEAEHVAELLSAADAACYAAKDQGRGRVHLFSRDDLDLARRTGEMRWVSEIHAAMENDRLRLRFQKIVNPSAPDEPPNRIEVLLSMVTDEGEAISPGVFIRAAERFSAMGRLDRWVVDRALKTLSTYWSSESWGLKQIFLNLSGTSIADDSFLAFLKDVFETHNVPPSAVVFEITETAAVNNLTEAIRFMQQLRDLGCRFALDDFGSGVSSFGYLRSLPVDYIKIDGTFVRGMAQDPIDRAIVESVQNVARELRIRTIAESVESVEVLRALDEMGIDLVQGFCLGRPTPIEQLHEEFGSKLAYRSSELELPSSTASRQTN